MKDHVRVKSTTLICLEFDLCRYAKNLSASPWHFPDGLAALQMPMMLFVQGYQADNVYTADYQFAGQSVSGADSLRFHTDRFSELVSVRPSVVLLFDVSFDFAVPGQVLCG